MNRNDTTKAIRDALRARSGKTWSVRGDRGTAYGWITITAPPKRCDKWGDMTDADRAELGDLLGLGRPAHRQGVNIPAGNDFYAEYIDRANGRTPTVHGVRYWD